MAEQSKRVSTTLGHGGCLALLFGIVLFFFFALPKNSPPFLLCKQQASLACFDLQNSGFANIPWFLSKGCSSGGVRTPEACGHGQEEEGPSLGGEGEDFGLILAMHPLSACGAEAKPQKTRLGWGHGAAESRGKGGSP